MMKILLNKDGDIGMGDSTDVSVSLGGEIFLGGKKCQESNIGDSDNTGDGGKIVGGAIGACSGIFIIQLAIICSLGPSYMGEVFPSEAGLAPLRPVQKNSPVKPGYSQECVYVVPTSKDIPIVSAGRPNMVPASRTIVSPGSIILGPG
ncbi:hypothetical protein Tco_0745431 [Tanacetum coccineum]